MPTKKKSPVRKKAHKVAKTTRRGTPLGAAKAFLVPPAVLASRVTSSARAREVFNASAKKAGPLLAYGKTSWFDAFSEAAAAMDSYLSSLGEYANLKARQKKSQKPRSYLPALASTMLTVKADKAAYTAKRLKALAAVAKVKV